ncbi:DinB family protein [Sporosarcina sp. Te-1]|uniref:DinB family protein n=1 Tax=Sporosarcina sp. Te-1 TaxID=2818390 RepID=UPI001A9DD6EE|nr:DinB family protein [Sporosarcina sp. Te-1]QTD43170.1 DinB family protein [Sporosarcina sp. Te-1]
MKTLFEYNWQVRQDWYRWCEEVEEEELLRARTGGVGSILQTLFHIIDVEWSWIRRMQGKSDKAENFDEYSRLQLIRELDARYKTEVEAFIGSWENRMEHNILEETLPDGQVSQDTWGEILRHLIAHEIHHMGQLSVWAREVGKEPISANVIGRGLVLSPQ